MSVGGAGVSTYEMEELHVTFDGGGSAIAIGDSGIYCPVSYYGRILSWHLAANSAGSIVIDVWKAFQVIPNAGNTIVGTEPPTLSSQSYNKNESISSWTTNLQPGDILGFSVTSASVTKAVLTIKIIKG